MYDGEEFINNSPTRHNHNYVLKLYALDAGYEVKTYLNAEVFLEKKDFDFDCYLVDWNLPGIPGIDLITEVRKVNNLAIIYLITANMEMADIRTGLMSGADDYLPKPYQPEQLKLKLANSYLKNKAITQVNFETGVKFVEDANMISIDGSKVFLTENEFRMARVLFEKRGQNVTRDDLEVALNLPTSSRGIEVHMHALRKKTQDTSLEIRNRRGVGYLWVCPSSNQYTQSLHPHKASRSSLH